MLAAAKRAADGEAAGGMNNGVTLGLYRYEMTRNETETGICKI